MKTNFEIKRIVSAKFTDYPQGVFQVTCGGTTKNYPAGKICYNQAGEIIAFCEWLCENQGLYEVAFEGQTDEEVARDILAEIEGYIEAKTTESAFCLPSFAVDNHVTVGSFHINSKGKQLRILCNLAADRLDTTAIILAALKLAQDKK